jgi:hypothetical protein
LLLRRKQNQPAPLFDDSNMNPPTQMRKTEEENGFPMKIANIPMLCDRANLCDLRNGDFFSSFFFGA